MKNYKEMWRRFFVWMREALGEQGGSDYITPEVIDGIAALDDGRVANAWEAMKIAAGFWIDDDRMYDVYCMCVDCDETCKFKDEEADYDCRQFELAERIRKKTIRMYGTICDYIGFENIEAQIALIESETEKHSSPKKLLENIPEEPDHEMLDYIGKVWDAIDTAFAPLTFRDLEDEEDDEQEDDDE